MHPQSAPNSIDHQRLGAADETTRLLSRPDPTDSVAEPRNEKDSRRTSRRTSCWCGQQHPGKNDANFFWHGFLSATAVFGVFFLIHNQSYNNNYYYQNDSTPSITASMINTLMTTTNNNNVPSNPAHTTHRFPPSSLFLQYPPIRPSNFGPLREYSVAHSDRSLDYLSAPFQTVVQNVHRLVTTAYDANHVAIVPGSGTFGMEAVVRQFVPTKKRDDDENQDSHRIMVIQNGYFGHRWIQILQTAGLLDENLHVTVLETQAALQQGNPFPQYQPPPLKTVLDTIRREQPTIVFGTHVETSTGIRLPNDYIGAMAEAIHQNHPPGLLVVDAIASGAIYLPTQELGIDVLIASPQKDWTSPPGFALIALSELAHERMMMKQSPSSSFSLDLSKWLSVMESYQPVDEDSINPPHILYHTTLPTDALRQFQQVSSELLATLGLVNSQRSQWDLGKRARAALDQLGLVSLAAPGFQAPGVLVYYTTPGGGTTSKLSLSFLRRGNLTDQRNVVAVAPLMIASPTLVQQLAQHEHIQIAHGLPWLLGDGGKGEGLSEDQKAWQAHQVFRIGLFGLDKLQNIERTVSILKDALQREYESLLSTLHNQRESER
mmetsp:Transcript_17887/g.48614  ORF Transcript_17887/g.48614 Transcript_17887/m.48614 type:complete len:604 (-) Transcript_17887:944-2755(-)